MSLSKVLVLRLSSIGDIILTSPFLRVLKNRFPDIELHYVVRNEYADLLRWNPHIDKLITIDVRHGRKALESLNLALTSERYDAVFDLHHHLRTRILRNGLSHRIHHVNKRAARRLLLVYAHVNTYGTVVPVPERYIETAARYGVAPDTHGPELFYPEAENRSAISRLTEAGWDGAPPLVALCPGSRHFTKRWPLEHYAELTTLLLELNATVLLLGSEEDAPAGRALHSLNERRVIDCCGTTSLLETAALLCQTTCVVANDSGLMHMATAVRRPVIALFGSTVREFGFFPYNSPAEALEIDGLPCRPCTFIGRASCPKAHFSCLRDISPSRVFEAVRSVLDMS
jgi:lipopolysaccharide heptosyltransferase II